MEYNTTHSHIPFLDVNPHSTLQIQMKLTRQNNVIRYHTRQIWKRRVDTNVNGWDRNEEHVNELKFTLKSKRSKSFLERPLIVTDFQQKISVVRGASRILLNFQPCKFCVPGQHFLNHIALNYRALVPDTKVGTKLDDVMQRTGAFPNIFWKYSLWITISKHHCDQLAFLDSSKISRHEKQ